MKTTSFNLIIIDESGSMCGAQKATIDGCNETLSAIRAIQKQFPDTQRCLASIYAFQSGATPSRYLVKNQPIDQVSPITERDYQPCGCTPMLDAVGQTLTDLRAVAATHEDATATVTIITDGYENSSREYTWKMVADLISQLKEEGWTFNFIGANIDVDKVSKQMSIDNVMAFCSDAAGTKAMFGSFGAAYSRKEHDRMCAEQAAPSASREEKVSIRKRMQKGFFNK